jgi:hypothetical protein
MPPAQYKPSPAYHSVASAIFRSRITSFSRHAMRVSPPRLGQLTRFLSASPASIFSQRSVLTILRRRRESLGSGAVLHPPIILNTDVESNCDTETVPDDRTLVEPRTLVTLPDETDSISLKDMPEDEVCTKTQCTTSRPFKSSEFHVEPERSSIIYPLPTAENLLTQEPLSPHTAADPQSFAAPVGIPCQLTPPPTHYKRRRARIISGEDSDPDLDRSSIRCVYVHSPPRGSTDVDGTMCRSNLDPDRDSAPQFPF